MFANRTQAGNLLALQLQEYENRNSCKNTVVIGLLRGGVPVAYEISKALKTPLDILAAKKISAPGNSELAIGAVTSNGSIVLSKYWGSYLTEEVDIDQQAKERIQAARDLDVHLRSISKLEVKNLANKRVMLIDDGIATGMTTLAAIDDVKKRGAESIMIAAPIIPEDTYRMLQLKCDQVIALQVVSDFESVGEFYEDFHQLLEEEVLKLLKN